VIRLSLRAILLLLLARTSGRRGDGTIAAAGGTPARRRPKAPSMKLVRDPVCGTWVSPRDSISLAIRGSTHYFCSDRCREQFQAR
jgi:YHS domain-containing protein